MAEKYKNWLHFTLAFLYRSLTLRQLTGLVSWKHPVTLEDGCTVVIGMCSKLPYVLPANLYCLGKSRWPDLKQVIVTVDALEGMLPEYFEEEMIRRFKSLHLRFIYYSTKQYRMAEKMKLPYVYCWMSWMIAISECRTKSILIHDYDALILGNVLEKRYRRFLESRAVMQGVSWYHAQGILPEDRLATTFEAFISAEWLRKFKPIRAMNQVGVLNGRRVDFDILTEMQAHGAETSERDVSEMGFEDLVHPTQMIHQYTVYRKFPGKAWCCSALTMIPFFYYLSGEKESFKTAIQKIYAARDKKTDLLDDACLINFSWLTSSEVDKMLKNMVQVCVKHNVPPFKDLVDYGKALYEFTGTPERDFWKGTFDASHKRWIETAGAL